MLIVCHLNAFSNEPNSFCLYELSYLDFHLYDTLYASLYILLFKAFDFEHEYSIKSVVSLYKPEI